MNSELLGAKAKKLLLVECASFSIFAAALCALIFSRSYVFHFEQVTMNFYTNGSTDFSTDVTSLVRSLGAVALFSLVFGVATGAAIGLTCSAHVEGFDSESQEKRYEEEMTKMGFVVINKTEEGTTYRLTDLGRRFLRDYRFLEKTEEAIA